LYHFLSHHRLLHLLPTLPILTPSHHPNFPILTNAGTLFVLGRVGNPFDGDDYRSTAVRSVSGDEGRCVKGDRWC
jgi:hypothetical protein